jgi:hypothetical protein
MMIASAAGGAGPHPGLSNGLAKAAKTCPMPFISPARARMTMTNDTAGVP